MPGKQWFGIVLATMLGGATTVNAQSLQQAINNGSAAIAPVSPARMPQINWTTLPDGTRVQGTGRVIQAQGIGEKPTSVTGEQVEPDAATPDGDGGSTPLGPTPPD